MSQDIREEINPSTGKKVISIDYAKMQNKILAIASVLKNQEYSDYCVQEKLDLIDVLSGNVTKPEHIVFSQKLKKDLNDSCGAEIF